MGYFKIKVQDSNRIQGIPNPVSVRNTNTRYIHNIPGVLKDSQILFFENKHPTPVHKLNPQISACNHQVAALAIKATLLVPPLDMDTSATWPKVRERISYPFLSRFN